MENLKKKKYFRKLKWYPIKLLFVILAQVISMRTYSYGQFFEIAYSVISKIMIVWLIVGTAAMVIQSKKHLWEIRNNDMEYSDYFELGLRIKQIHAIAFVLMLPVAVFFALMIFTIFITLIIFMGYCICYWWNSKIVKIGLHKAYEENLMNKKELKIYSLCQYVYILDWLSLKYLDYKL